MKTKKQYALNKLFNFFTIIILLSMLAIVDLFILKDYKDIWALLFFVVILLLSILPIIFTPYCYAFDSEGVSLRYVFFPVERYLWNDIHAIEVYDKGIGTRRPIFIEPLYAYVFLLHGKNVGERRFYMKGHIRKSFRTKKLLEKYWDGTITGYLLKSIKDWFLKHINKHKSKKQAQIDEFNRHMTEEVVAMERDLRANTRKWLKPYIAQAKQHNLEIRSNYYYVTKDFDELASRPKEGYTYTLIAEISEADETDETRIYVANVELLYVRLGRTMYRGVINEHAKEKLELGISSTLDDIIKNGI